MIYAGQMEFHFSSLFCLYPSPEFMCLIFQRSMLACVCVCATNGNEIHELLKASDWILFTETMCECLFPLYNDLLLFRLPLVPKGVLPPLPPGSQRDYTLLHTPLRWERNGTLHSLLSAVWSFGDKKKHQRLPLTPPWNARFYAIFFARSTCEISYHQTKTLRIFINVKNARRSFAHVIQCITESDIAQVVLV